MLPPELRKEDADVSAAAALAVVDSSALAVTSVPEAVVTGMIGFRTSLLAAISFSRSPVRSRRRL